MSEIKSPPQPSPQKASGPSCCGPAACSPTSGEEAGTCTPRTPADLAMLAELLTALADPQRLVLVCNLAGRAEPATVTEASTCCGVHLSGVSRHLAQLKRAGVVEARKVGREVLYSLRQRELAATLRQVADWLEAGAPCCEAPSEHSTQR